MALKQSLEHFLQADYIHFAFFDNYKYRRTPSYSSSFSFLSSPDAAQSTRTTFEFTTVFFFSHLFDTKTPSQRVSFCYIPPSRSAIDCHEPTGMASQPPPRGGTLLSVVLLLLLAFAQVGQSAVAAPDGMFPQAFLYHATVISD